MVHRPCKAVGAGSIPAIGSISPELRARANAGLPVFNLALFLHGTVSITGTAADR